MCIEKVEHFLKSEQICLSQAFVQFYLKELLLFFTRDWLSTELDVRTFFKVAEIFIPVIDVTLDRRN